MVNSERKPAVAAATPPHPPRWYFAHPHTRQEGGERLRQYLQRLSGVELINPFHQKLELINPTPTVIVEADLAVIRATQGLCAWVPRDEPQVGTFMEILYAARVCGRPVVIYAAPRYAGNPWLLAHGQVCGTVGAVVDALRRHA